MIQMEIVRQLTEKRRIKLKLDELQMLGSVAEYHLHLYAEKSITSDDLQSTGLASQVYQLYQRLLSRVLGGKDVIQMSFSPVERATLQYLLSEYYPKLGVWGRMVAYRLREKLELK